eukprot:TRINITY_DN3167_c1_g2_i3.p1 TRINITY_DN3167_c1_g2~~TRINITY_DN3167_c1_g2_i3.p1  ORF type:complete len:108 (-),score=2.16 TRINITY_DN3167_c1_g2_i3:161-484(-)
MNIVQTVPGRSGLLDGISNTPIWAPISHTAPASSRASRSAASSFVSSSSQPPLGTIHKPGLLCDVTSSTSSAAASRTTTPPHTNLWCAWSAQHLPERDGYEHGRKGD